MAMATATETTGENFAAPYRGPIDAIKTCIKKSFDFRGRASRSEFWWFWILVVVVKIATIELIGGENNFLAVTWGWFVIFILTSVTLRRLHDTNRGVMWLLFLYFPLFVATIFEIVFSFSGQVLENLSAGTWFFLVIWFLNLVVAFFFWLYWMVAKGKPSKNKFDA